MPSSTRRQAPRAGTSRASIREARSRRDPHPNPPPFAGREWAGAAGGSGSDEAVDLAVAEQPLSAFFDHFVLVGTAGADFGAFRLFCTTVQFERTRAFAPSSAIEILVTRCAARGRCSPARSRKLRASSAIAARPVAWPNAVSQVPFSVNSAAI